MSKKHNIPNYIKPQRRPIPPDWDSCGVAPYIVSSRETSQPPPKGMRRVALKDNTVENHGAGSIENRGQQGLFQGGIK